jgi:hypothetical protein
MKNNIFICSLSFGFITLATFTAKAQVQPLEINRTIVQENPKAYCTPIPGQAAYNGGIVTVPMGHDCSSWLNYLLQQEITEKNVELRQEEIETNAKLQLYLNTTPRW